jgi:hypothetical protein
MPCQSPSMEERNSAVPVASMEERCAVPVATLHAGGSEVAGAGNLRSRLAAAGQNIQGGSAPASGAASAQRAHNGVDDGRLAVAKCIKILETLIHMGATIDSVGVGQCQARFARERKCQQTVPGSESGSFALARGRRWQQTLCAARIARSIRGQWRTFWCPRADAPAHVTSKIVAGHISRQKSSSANPSIPGSPPFTLSPFPFPAETVEAARIA